MHHGDIRAIHRAKARCPTHMLTSRLERLMTLPRVYHRLLTDSRRPRLGCTVSSFQITHRILCQGIQNSTQGQRLEGEIPKVDHCPNAALYRSDIRYFATSAGLERGRKLQICRSRRQNQLMYYSLIAHISPNHVRRPSISISTSRSAF